MITRVIERASELVPCSKGHPSEWTLVSQPKNVEYSYIGELSCTDCNTQEEFELYLKNQKGFQVA